jgi:hypothetical protein
MRILYPTNGSGCRVIVGQGFLDGFNDDNPGSNLHGLTGVTFSFDDQFQLTGVHPRNGGVEKWDGPYMAKLASFVREWAQEQRPPTTSGFRPAVKMPWEAAPIPKEPPSEPRVKYTPIPREEPDEPPPREPVTPWYQKDLRYNYKVIPGKAAVLIRRRKAS